MHLFFSHFTIPPFLSPSLCLCFDDLIPPLPGIQPGRWIASDKRGGIKLGFGDIFGINDPSFTCLFCQHSFTLTTIKFSLNQRLSIPSRSLRAPCRRPPARSTSTSSSAISSPTLFFIPPEQRESRDRHSPPPTMTPSKISSVRKYFLSLLWRVHRSRCTCSYWVSSNWSPKTI